MQPAKWKKQISRPILSLRIYDENQIQSTVATIDRICQSNVDQVDMQRLPVKAHVADIRDRLTSEEMRLRVKPKLEKDTLGSPLKKIHQSGQ